MKSVECEVFSARDVGSGLSGSSVQCLVFGVLCSVCSTQYSVFSVWCLVSVQVGDVVVQC